MTAGNREYPSRPIVSAHAIAFDGDRVLLVQRANPPHQGRWSVPGGAVELGETVRAAVRREVREECGVEIEVERLFTVLDSIMPDDQGRVRFHYVVLYLLARCAGGEARADSDALAVRWAGRGELATLDMPKGLRAILEDAFGARA